MKRIQLYIVVCVCLFTLCFGAKKALALSWYTGCDASQSENRFTIICQLDDADSDKIPAPFSNLISMYFLPKEYLENQTRSDLLEMAVADSKGVITKKNQLNIAEKTYQAYFYNLPDKTPSVVILVDHFNSQNAALIHFTSQKTFKRQVYLQVFETLISKGIPDEMLNAAYEKQKSHMNFLGKVIKLPAGCETMRKNSVQCGTGQLSWEVTDTEKQAYAKMNQSMAHTKEGVLQSGQNWKFNQNLACFIDGVKTNCANVYFETDLPGMQGKQKLNIYYSVAKIREQWTMLICSFWDYDAKSLDESFCSTLLRLEPINVNEKKDKAVKSEP
jgi:hypothetical protein